MYVVWNVHFVMIFAQFFNALCDVLDLHKLSQNDNFYHVMSIADYDILQLVMYFVSKCLVKRFDNVL